MNDCGSAGAAVVPSKLKKYHTLLKSPYFPLDHCLPLVYQMLSGAKIAGKLLKMR
jgi:hypothetical protein